MSTVMLPRRPIFIMSPKRLELVGSPTTQASIFSPRSARRFSILTVPLTAGPSSSPVISRLIEALVREPIDQGSTHFQPTSLQFTTVDVGNKATNIAPGVAKARFNVRFNDLWTSKTLLAHLKERLDRAHAAMGGNGTIELSTEVSGESFYTPPGPLSELVAGAIRDVAGVEAELSTTGGTSDARFIRSYCPVLEFGLVGETMHKVDEKSAVADLRTLTRVYETVLDRYFAA